MFQVNDFSINDYMISTCFTKEVLEGSSERCEIDVMRPCLSDCGIKYIANIKCRFTAYDWKAIQMYYILDPVKIITANTGKYFQTVDDSGHVLYDQNGIRFIYKKYSGGTCYLDYYLFIENNRNQRISIKAENVHINNAKIDTHF